MLSFYLSLLSDPADKEKIAQIYEKYRQMMYATAYEILRSRYDAEDAVHESFIRLASNLHKVNISDGQKTAAYLVTIVKNVARTHIKKQYREVPASNIVSDDEEDESIIERIQSKNHLPVDQVHINSVREILLSSINQIKPLYRDVLIMYYLEDKSVKEVAATLDLAENTVSKRLNRGRTALYDILAKEGYHAEDFRF